MYSPPIDWIQSTDGSGTCPIVANTPLFYNSELNSLSIAPASDKIGGYVTNSGTQKFAGIKQFLTVPECAIQPSAGSQLANKTYVDNVAGSSFTPLQAIDEIGDAAAVVGPTDGYRVLQNTTGGGFTRDYIYTYDDGTSAWVEYIPTVGNFVLNNDDMLSYIYTSSGWTKFEIGLGGDIICNSIQINDATASTSTGTGALICAGGAGIAENIYAGGIGRFNTVGAGADPGANIALQTNGAIRMGETAQSRFVLPASTSTNMWNIDNLGGGMRFYRCDYAASGLGGANAAVKATLSDAGNLLLSSTSTAQLTLANGAQNTTFTTSSGGDLTIDCSGNDIIMHSSDRALVQNTTVSSTKTNGALVVSGGIGCAGQITANQFVADNSSTTDSFSAEFYAPSLQITKYHGIRFGQSGTVWNCADLRFNYIGPGDLTNYVTLGPYGYAGALRIDRTGIQAYQGIFTTTTTPQLRVGYDAANYCNFTMSSAGDLTMNATGNDINFHSSDTVIVLNTTGSSSSTTGALQVKGGLGVTENIYAGGVIWSTGLNASSLTVSNPTAGAVNIQPVNVLCPNVAATGSVNIGIGKATTSRNYGTLRYYHSGDGSVDNYMCFRMNGTPVSELQLTSNGLVKISGTTASSAKTNGCLILSGGLGCADQVSANRLYCSSDGAASTYSIASYKPSLDLGEYNGFLLGVNTGVARMAGVIQFFNMDGGGANLGNFLRMAVSNASGGLHLSAGGYTSITSTEEATDAANGALRVAGGMGVSKKIYAGSSLNVATSVTAQNANFTRTSPNQVVIGYDASHYSAFSIESNGNTSLFSQDENSEFKIFGPVTVGGEKIIMVGENNTDSRMCAQLIFHNSNSVGSPLNYAEIRLSDSSGQGLRVDGTGNVTHEEEWDDLSMFPTAKAIGQQPFFAPVNAVSGMWGFMLAEYISNGVLFSGQLPHTWKPGTSAYLHCHACWNGNPTAGQVTRLRAVVYVQKINSDSVNTYEETIDYPSGGIPAYTQKLIELVTVPASALAPSCLFNIEIWREGADVEDTESRKCGLMAADFHFAKNRFGEQLY